MIFYEQELALEVAPGPLQGLGLGGGGDSRVLERFRGLREKPCVC